MAKIWHFCSFWARPCWLIWCPVGELIGGCGARAVSRKTPIYFIKWIQLPYELIRYLHLIYVHISSYFWTLQMQIMVWEIGQKIEFAKLPLPWLGQNPNFFRRSRWMASLS